MSYTLYTTQTSKCNGSPTTRFGGHGKFIVKEIRYTMYHGPSLFLFKNFNQNSLWLNLFLLWQPRMVVRETYHSTFHSASVTSGRDVSNTFFSMTPSYARQMSTWIIVSSLYILLYNLLCPDEPPTYIVFSLQARIGYKCLLDISENL